MPCKHPGCAALVPYGGSYCENHKPQYREEKRTTSAKGYGAKWRRAREHYLKANPLCGYCRQQGRLVKAEVVDHIKPHRGDDELFWNEQNWQPLCKKCHDQKTMTTDRYQEYHY